MKLVSNFVKEFRRRLEESKTDKLLIRLINENLQAFGPRKNGSNLLINRFLPKECSILRRFDKLMDSTIKDILVDEQRQALI